MIVDCAHYVLGARQSDGGMTLQEAAACRRSGGSFVWIEVHEPNAAVMDELRLRFDLHELAVEDASRAHQRPKVESYDDFHFIVFRTARYDAGRAEVTFGEVELFVGRGYVIAVRHGPTADLQGIRARLEKRPQLLRSGPAAVVWGILDAVVDDYRPVIEGLENDIDEAEGAVFTGGEDPTQRIYFLRREVADLFRTVHPLLEPLGAMQKGAFEQVDPALMRYFRDVHDHVRRLDEEIVAQRDQLTTALEANLSLISVRQNEIAARQNEIVKSLTILASVFLPLSFVTGFFGQNFAWLTDHLKSQSDFLYIGIGGVAITFVVVVAAFRRGHYL